MTAVGARRQTVFGRPDYRAIGKRIRQARDDAGFAPKELAHKLGMKVQSLYNVEHGRFGFSLDFLIAVALALEVSTDHLLGIERELHPETRRIAFRIDRLLRNGGNNG